MNATKISLRQSFSDQLLVVAQRSLLEGRFRRAIVACRLIDRIVPNQVDALFCLGHAYSAIGRFELAVKAFRQVEETSPPHAGACIHQALAHLADSNLPSAHESALRALKISPEMPAASLVLGYVHQEGHDYDEALKCWEDALAFDPKYLDACLAIAQMQVDRGRREDALVWFEKASSLSPESLKLAYLLVTSRCHPTSNLEMIDQISRLLSTTQASTEDRKSGHFALGELLDREGRYDEAFFHFRAGNELAAKTDYDRFDQRRLNSDIACKRKVFTAAFMEKHRKSVEHDRSDKLVFIVGMPRSGTTLVEQILATHPEVVAGGERPEIRKIVDRLPLMMGTKIKYPNCLRKLDVHLVQRIVEDHMAAIDTVAPGAMRYTDKLPENFADLGLIRLLFPRAKIIHCKRNPLDVAVSCYAQNFTYLYYTRSLEHIGGFLEYYYSLMSFWKSVFGSNLLEIEYEELTASPEDTIRVMLEYCDLPWEPRCLSFHETSRVAKTASRCQVKRPIYSTSVARWKNYEKYLAPVVSRLPSGVELASTRPHSKIPLSPNAAPAAS